MNEDNKEKNLVISAKHFILMCWFMWALGFFVGAGI